jgi:hypothetical protein
MYKKENKFIINKEGRNSYYYTILLILTFKFGKYNKLNTNKRKGLIA